MFDFKRILELHNELRRKNRAITTMWERATDTTVHITDMPRGGGNGQQMENSILNIREAEEDRDRVQQDLDEMIRQLRSEMKVLKKWQYREIIKKRYIEGKRLEQVAFEMSYCWSHMNRCRKEAEDLINRKHERKRG